MTIFLLNYGCSATKYINCNKKSSRRRRCWKFLLCSDYTARRITKSVKYIKKTETFPETSSLIKTTRITVSHTRLTHLSLKIVNFKINFTNVHNQWHEFQLIFKLSLSSSLSFSSFLIFLGLRILPGFEKQTHCDFIVFSRWFLLE